MKREKTTVYMDEDQWANQGQRAFRAVFDGDPDCVGAAPGRVNLIGGHTDYNDGFVLPVAIDRHTVVAGRRRPDETVVVHSQTLDETAEFQLSTLEPQHDGAWVDYIAGVIDAIGTEKSVGGMDLIVTGDVPLGAGLSSSAALELAVGAVVRETFDLELDDQTLTALCRSAETDVVGVSCGIMDQYTATFGETDHALFLDCREQTHECVHLSGDVRIVVVDTNVKHELAGSAYNERVTECQQGVAEFESLLSHEVNALRDVSVEEFETYAASIGQPVRDRCEHVIRENERVRLAASALENGEIDECGKLMFSSHESLERLYEVSCHELDVVVDCARETEGVVGARMTGGGFGGSVVALVSLDAVDSFVEAVHETYPEETGVEADIHICGTSDGVRVSNRENGAEEHTE
ncbi:galactokinase [Haladaptatus sp. NG-WS-4]